MCPRPTCALLIVLAITLAACTGVGAPGATDTAEPAHAPADTATRNGLRRWVQAGPITVWAADDDWPAAEAVAAAIAEYGSGVCDALATSCELPAVVEIYPDQARFDQYVMNPRMRGYFAISGDGTIQMVSPRMAASVDLSYEDRVQIAVHEYAHLALDEVNPALPTWLDEGAAVYVGPHGLYETVCQYAFPFEQVPALTQLENAYGDVPAADLFAYAAVEYVARGWGMATLNDLLRSPDNLEGVLGLSREAFEAEWHAYMEAHYHNDAR